MPSLLTRPKPIVPWDARLTGLLLLLVDSGDQLG